MQETLPHDNSNLRVAIIGAGMVVQRGHISNFQSIPHVSVEAICDVNEERLESVAAAEGIPQTSWHPKPSQLFRYPTTPDDAPGFIAFIAFIAASSI